MKKLVTVIGIIAILSTLFSFFMGDNTEEHTVKSSHEITKVESINHTTEVAQKKSGVVQGIGTFLKYTGFKNVTVGHVAMIFVGLLFIFLAIKYDLL